MITEYEIAEEYVKLLIEEKQKNPESDLYIFSRGYLQAIKNLFGNKANSRLIRCIMSYEEFFPFLKEYMNSSFFKQLYKDRLVDKDISKDFIKGEKIIKRKL